MCVHYMHNLSTYGISITSIWLDECMVTYNCDMLSPEIIKELMLLNQQVYIV